MNYIKQVNTFYKLIQNNPLSSNAQCLYNYLLNKNNELGWIKEFTVSNMIVCGFTGLSRQALDRARNELKLKGYIDYKKGISNHAGKYLIVDFDTQDNTQDSTQSDIQDNTQGGHEVSTLNKLKETKQNKKENEKEKYFENEKINKSFEEWLEYKKQRKEKYTDIGLKKLITQINKQLKKHTVDEIVNLIDTCMERNYKGIIFGMLPKNTDTDIPDWVSDWANGKD